MIVLPILFWKNPQGNILWAWNMLYTFNKTFRSMKQKYSVYAILMLIFNLVGTVVVDVFLWQACILMLPPSPCRHGQDRRKYVVTSCIAGLGPTSATYILTLALCDGFLLCMWPQTWSEKCLRKEIGTLKVVLMFKYRGIIESNVGVANYLDSRGNFI